jgi:hypothetical protein
MPEATNDTPSATGRRLIGIDDICPGRIQMSKRAWLRLCDAGRAPWGVKLGNRRLWDAAELEAWIAKGCPSIGKVIDLLP